MRLNSLPIALAIGAAGLAGGIAISTGISARYGAGPNGTKGREFGVSIPFWLVGAGALGGADSLARSGHPRLAVASAIAGSLLVTMAAGIAGTGVVNAIGSVTS